MRGQLSKIKIHEIKLKGPGRVIWCAFWRPTSWPHRPSSALGSADGVVEEMIPRRLSCSLLSGIFEIRPRSNSTSSDVHHPAGSMAIKHHALRRCLDCSWTDHDVPDATRDLLPNGDLCGYPGYDTRRLYARLVKERAPHARVSS